MPFTRKDGTLIFTDAADVEQYYRELELSQAPDGLTGAEFRYKQNTLYLISKEPDRYYLNFIATAESVEELGMLRNAYYAVLIHQRGLLEEKEYALDAAFHQRLTTIK